MKNLKYLFIPGNRQLPTVKACGKAIVPQFLDIDHELKKGIVDICSKVNKAKNVSSIIFFEE